MDRSLIREILDEWDLCLNARVPSNVVELQLEKDMCAILAQHLDHTYVWELDDESLTLAYNAFAPKLQHLKERIVLEVLSGPLPMTK